MTQLQPSGPAQAGLPPLQDSFPESRKIAHGDLQVPRREITLTNGEIVQTYDTTGPQ